VSDTEFVATEATTGGDAVTGATVTSVGRLVPCSLTVETWTLYVRPAVRPVIASPDPIASVFPLQSIALLAGRVVNVDAPADWY